MIERQIETDTRVLKAFYCIAGLHLEVVSFDGGFNRREILPSFEPFISDHTEGQQCACSIELVSCTLPALADGGLLRSDKSVEWGENFRFHEYDDYYLTSVGNAKDASLLRMRSNKDFSRSVIYTPKREEPMAKAISWLMMVAFGQASLLHQTILIHASVISCGELGYAFLGKSGTGKSTHSRLWLEAMENTELLNDDNPAIRLQEDGNIYVYGTPWSGKTSCYKNMKVPLQAFVRLKQAPYNKMSIKKGMNALVDVLPSCTGIRWNKQLFNAMTDTLEMIIQRVPVTELECLPDLDAARLCYHEILKIKN